MALLAGRWPAAAPLSCSSGCGGLSKISPRGRRPLKIAQCSGTGVVICDATALGDLLIPLYQWSIIGQECGEDGKGERVRTLKRRRRLRVTTRLFSLFVRDPRTVDFREHTFLAGSVWAEPPILWGLCATFDAGEYSAVQVRSAR